MRNTHSLWSIRRRCIAWIRNNLCRCFRGNRIRLDHQTIRNRLVDNRTIDSTLLILKVYSILSKVNVKVEKVLLSGWNWAYLLRFCYCWWLCTKICHAYLSWLGLRFGEVHRKTRRKWKNKCNANYLLFVVFVVLRLLNNTKSCVLFHELIQLLDVSGIHSDPFDSLNLKENQYWGYLWKIIPKQRY